MMMLYNYAANKIKSNVLYVLLLAAFFYPSTTEAQITIAGGTTAAGNYTKLSTAISSLNGSTITGAVTVSVNTGFTETLSARINMTATGTPVNTITIVKAGGGANPVITAYTGGSGTPASATPDGIFSLQGCDYVTIDGIDFKDNAANTTNPAAMEYGIGLFRNSATDGCQNVTIKNCIITLNRINNAAGTAPMADGSVGILLINSKPTTANTAVVPTSAAGANSNNKIYSNTIQNCNIGIALMGYADVSPFTVADMNNDVGGSSSGTANQILNFGGGGTTTAAAGIRTLAQYEVNISYNTINNNNGSGVNHATTLRGVYHNTATSAGGTISNNNVTVISAAATSTVTGIENTAGSTAASNTIAINNNTLNVQHPGATTGSTYGIYNNGASPAILNLNGNNVSLSTAAASLAENNCILNTGEVGSAITIDNNVISSVTFTAASSCVFKAINNTAGTASTSLSISNNEFKQVTYSLTGTGEVYMVYTSPTLASETISNNNLNNLTLNNNASVFLLYSGSSSPLVTLNGNYITTQFSRSVLSTNFFYAINKTGGPVNGIITISNNLLTNISPFSNSFGNNGIFVSTSTTSTQEVFGNTVSIINGTSTGTVVGISISSGLVSNIYSNTITGMSSGSSIYAIYLSGSSTVTCNVYSNKVTGITGNGGSTIGVNIAGGNTVNVYKNILYDCSNSGPTAVIYGILINPSFGPSTTNAYNNFIGKLSAPVTSSTGTSVVGIYLGSLLSSITGNVDFNTIYLNTSSSGAEFSSSCILSSTGPTLTLRNNLLINLSTQKGSGKTVAYRRLGTSLTTYTTSSDNNLFYAGVPSSGRLIFYDGTNSKQTLAEYIDFVSPRDANSKSELVNFLSTDVASSDLLKINSAIGTIAESGGKSVAGISTDYFGTARDATQPDIGAHEFSGFNDASAAVISFAQLNTTCSTADVTLSGVTITDASGIPVSGTLMPRIYYKKNSGSYFSNAGTLTSGSATNGTWSFTIQNSDMGGVISGDVISYYIIAQDLVGVPNTNVGSNPSGVSATDVNAVSVHPTPLSYSIGASLTFYQDADGDGYGNAGVTVLACSAPTGYVGNNTDCNDANAGINPIATDVCNGIDDNCNTVIDENSITATISPSGNVSVCDGSSILLSANTGSGITYQWIKGSKNLSGETNSTYTAKKAADYKVSESNIFGCTSTSAATTLTLLAVPSPTITPLGNLDICATGSVVLQANGGTGLLYQWKKGSNILAGETNQNYTATTKGTYKVDVTNSNGCSKTSTGTKVTKSCKAASLLFAGQPVLELFPNPASSSFRINLNLDESVNSKAGIFILDLYGRVLQSFATSVDNGILMKDEFAVHDLPAGNYLVKLVIESNTYLQQLLIEH